MIIIKPKGMLMLKDDLNLIKIAEKHIIHELQGVVYDRIMNQLVEQFKKDAESIVKKQVEKAIIISLKTIHDCNQMKDEVVAYVKWDDDKEPQYRVINGNRVQTNG